MFGADSSFVVKVHPKLYSYVGCVCVDSDTEAVSKVDAHGKMTYVTSAAEALLSPACCMVNTCNDV